MSKRTKHKKIRLYPTGFHLHVFMYHDSLDELEKSFRKVWPKENFECYIDSIKPHETAFVDSLVTKNEKTIIMVIREPIESTIVHECHHVLYRLQDYTGVEVCSDAQEWGAYFTDYIFDEIKAMI